MNGNKRGEKILPPFLQDDHVHLMRRHPFFAPVFLLMILGIVVVVGGALLIILQSGGKVSGGALIMIGPFPIIIGSDSTIVTVLIVVAVALIAMYIWRIPWWMRSQPPLRGGLRKDEERDATPKPEGNSRRPLPTECRQDQPVHPCGATEFCPEDPEKCVFFRGGLR